MKQKVLMETIFTAHHMLAFAADTQAPMLVETILLKSFKNRQATALLFNDVLQKTPGAFFLLGDVVNLGYSSRQWKPIDGYLQAFQSAAIPVHAIMGNHEVMGRPQAGEKKFQQRFPLHKRTGYVCMYAPVAVVLVNSNFSALSKADDKKQTEWFYNTLQALDDDAAIHSVIIGCHHSPFTNSRIVKPSKEAEKKFVPPYLQSRKAQLFLSGHCHAFEHYKVEGKDFLVIGGGGGLRQPLRQGLGTLADLAPGYKPAFHYITTSSTDDGLIVQAWHINKAFDGFEEGISFQIKKM